MVAQFLGAGVKFLFPHNTMCQHILSFQDKQDLKNMTFEGAAAALVLFLYHDSLGEVGAQVRSGWASGGLSGGASGGVRG